MERLIILHVNIITNNSWIESFCAEASKHINYVPVELLINEAVEMEILEKRASFMMLSQSPTLMNEHSDRLFE